MDVAVILWPRTCQTMNSPSTNRVATAARKGALRFEKRLIFVAAISDL